MDITGKILNFSKIEENVTLRRKPSRLGLWCTFIQQQYIVCNHRSMNRSPSDFFTSSKRTWSKFNQLQLSVPFFVETMYKFWAHNHCCWCGSTCIPLQSLKNRELYDNSWTKKYVFETSHWLGIFLMFLSFTEDPGKAIKESYKLQI